MASLASSSLVSPTPSPLKGRFPARAASAFGKLAGLYALYAGWTLFGGFHGAPYLERLVLIGGLASFALAVLVAPAVFVASGDFDLFGERGQRERRRDWKWLGLLAMGACLLAEIGVPLSEYLMDVVSPDRTRGVPEPGVRYYDRILVPIAVAVFVVTSGVAGAVVYYMTQGSSSFRRSLVRFLTCLGLIVLFWASLLICGELVRSNTSVPVVLMVVGPPLLPLLLTTGLLRSQGYGVLEVAGLDRRMDRWLDAEALDRLLDAVHRQDEPNARPLAEVTRSQTELDAARFMLALRRAAAPAVRVSEAEAHETVARVLATAAPAEAVPSRSTILRLPSLPSLERIGDFGVSWASLSAGLVLFGLVAAVPPNAVAALTLGLLGVVLQARWSRQTPTLAPTAASA